MSHFWTRQRDIYDAAYTSRADLVEAGVETKLSTVSLSTASPRRSCVTSCRPRPFTLGSPPGEPATIGPLTVASVHTLGHNATTSVIADPVTNACCSPRTFIEPFQAATIIHASFDGDVKDDVATIFTALDRFAGLDIKWVFPGHGPVFDGVDDTVQR